ncbi:hypothetical protein AMECASPLE_028326 [Ameca splendens]|uniref:Uncharacterized protein n=1 Tax=Ameca splendens TaxID=208324 RepID=A0ABV0Y5M9_9TELE
MRLLKSYVPKGWLCQTQHLLSLLHTHSRFDPHRRSSTVLHADPVDRERGASVGPQIFSSCPQQERVNSPGLVSLPPSIRPLLSVMYDPHQHLCPCEHFLPSLVWRY